MSHHGRHHPRALLVPVAACAALCLTACPRPQNNAPPPLESVDARMAVPQLAPPQVGGRLNLNVPVLLPPIEVLRGGNVNNRFAFPDGSARPADAAAADAGTAAAPRADGGAGGGAVVAAGSDAGAARPAAADAGIAPARRRGR